MNLLLESSWQKKLHEEFSKPYYGLLLDFVQKAYATSTVYPPANLVFNAFNQCPFDQVKVVIIGQDPYHGAGQAHGLCFSVNDGVPLPPSLLNIYKEIERDLAIAIPASGNLERWARQGVLLINATLTVTAGLAGSHHNKGWEKFTDAVIQRLSEEKSHIVFMLWGSYAQKKGTVIDTNKHLVLKAVHPSPLSAYRGFIGCGHFGMANYYLEAYGITPVEW